MPGDEVSNRRDARGEGSERAGGAGRGGRGVGDGPGTLVSGVAQSVFGAPGDAE